MAKILAILLSAALLPVASGCKEIECGDGTIERDGACEPAGVTPDPTRCGTGTQLENGECRPIFDPTTCDPDTTFVMQDPDTGVFVCFGSGGGGCNAPLPGCDMAASGTMTVCGRIYDIENDTAVSGGGADTSECPSGGETAGPCALRVTPYDALAFAGGARNPLVTAQTYLDHCGRFKLRDIQPAGAPFIGLGVDDHPMQADSNKTTGVAFPTETNVARTNLVAYITRNATDTLWTTGAGEATSLAEQGVYVNIYRDHGTSTDPFAGEPAAGVQILRSGIAIPPDDYYFADTTPSTRTMVAPTTQTVTGANGTGFVLRQPGLAPYTGTPGPLPGGCTWYQSTGGTVTNVVFAQIHPPATQACTF
jgi:hypothetical protein